MSDFCNICAEDMGFTKPDIDVYAMLDELETGHSVQFGLCEGCGISGVGKDSDDECYVLVVTDIGAGEGLWIPLHEWENTLFMVKSSNNNLCVDIGEKPKWIKDKSKES